MAESVFDLSQGERPLRVSLPHVGTLIPTAARLRCATRRRRRRNHNRASSGWSHV
jgi:N-formylglutamate amidohydrolase